MLNFLKYIIAFVTIFLSIKVEAQIDINIDINKMVQNSDFKGSAPKKNINTKETAQIKLPKVDEFRPIDSKMKLENDYSLGAFDFNWGDPVDEPAIRRNTANNLYGEVRYNEDGTKRWHRGFDYYAPIGTPVRSVGQGTVESTGNSESYGLYVQIKHIRGKSVYYSFYAHLSSVSVKSGQNVQKGTIIGKSGISGNASNLCGEDEHVHLEYRIVPESGKGYQANPNAIVKTRFYSADPENPNQSNVSVTKYHK